MNKLFYWLGFFLFLGLLNPVLSKSDLTTKKISENSKNGNSKINNKETKYKSFANLAYSERKSFKNKGKEFNLPLNFEKFFNNLLVSFENDSKIKNSNVQELEILADYEELSGSIISAKGNVIISNKKAVLNLLPLQPGDVEYTHADITKIQNWTGYKPQVTFEEGLKEFSKWYEKFYK